MIFAPTDSAKVLWHPDRLAIWLKNGRSFPVSVEIDATNACNHACSFCCWSVLHEHHRDTMSPELLAKIVDDIASVGVKGVIWTGGGEPLVNKHTPAAIARAKGLGLHNGLFTNAALVTPEIASQLVETCDWIRVSIAAGTRDEYHRIQGVDDFDRVWENLGLLVAAARQSSNKPRIGAMMLLHKSSLATFLPFVERCRDIGLEFAEGKPHNNYDHEERSMYIQERNVHLRQRAGDEDAQVDEEVADHDPAWWANEARPMVTRAEALTTPDFQVVTPQYAEEKYGAGTATQDSTHSCEVNNFVTAITASGKVVWCKNYRDREEFVIGNLKDQTMEEIWASERRREVQEMIDTRACARFCQNKRLKRILERMREPDAAIDPNFL
ncbi:MAG: cyclic pyranopterin phosphate synthase [Planctomycetota bacterium]|jgi:cyclic pyranopterin phosphate synthase